MSAGSIERDIGLNMAMNPFVPNAPFFYLLKTSENRKDFWCFQGLEKGCIGSKWVQQKGLEKDGSNV